MLTIINKSKDNGLIDQVIGSERVHNLVIRTRAKKGYFFELIFFIISNLEAKSEIQSKGSIIRRSLVQIQPPAAKFYILLSPEKVRNVSFFPFRLT